MTLKEFKKKYPMLLSLDKKRVELKYVLVAHRCQELGGKEFENLKKDWNDLLKFERTGYKIVTKNLKSLGLRRNPTILDFKIKKWTKSPEVTYDKADKGGIWCCKNLSGARKLKKYMKNKYNKNVLIFECKIGNILYMNSYRIKTDKLKLIKSI